jgi:hypothetical protein
MNVICTLWLIVVPIPPDKNQFAVKINNAIYAGKQILQLSYWFMQASASSGEGGIPDILPFWIYYEIKIEKKTGNIQSIH